MNEITVRRFVIFFARVKVMIIKNRRMILSYRTHKIYLADLMSECRTMTSLLSCWIGLSLKLILQGIRNKSDFCLQQHSRERHLKTDLRKSWTHNTCVWTGLYDFIPKPWLSHLAFYMYWRIFGRFYCNVERTCVLSSSLHTFSRNKSWDTAPWMPKLLLQKCKT